jgi:hypothetical protein
MFFWGALVWTGYGDEVSEYRGRLYVEHGLPLCEIHVDIHPTLCFLMGGRGQSGSSRRQGPCLREGSSRGAHHHVIIAPVRYNRHAHRTLPDSETL